MMNETQIEALPTAPRLERGVSRGAEHVRPGLDWAALPWLSLLFLLGIAVLYAPTLVETARLHWFASDDSAHGIFILPLSGFLLWVQRDRLARSGCKPAWWGLLLVAAGLLVQCGSYLLQLKYLGMWSLVITLAGAALVLRGWEFFRIASFPIGFLLFAAPVPHSLITSLTHLIQGVSVEGATALMSLLGYPLLRHTNVIEIPGATLEVADACSGYHKLMSLCAFSALYSYLFTTSPIKRALLMAATFPVAAVSNILRICGLIAVTYSGGMTAFHAAHDYADLIAVGVAFCLFIPFGKVLGCKTLRFSLF